MLIIETVLGLLILLVAITFSSSLIALKRYTDTKQELAKAKEKNKWLMEAGTQTPKVSEIKGEGLDIPASDQDYLEPIIVEWLKWVVKTKQNTPTNAMLIDHLVDAIGMALNDYEKPKDGKYQRKNEGWLLVSAYATRLYMEGTPHDSSDLRDSLQIAAHFADNNLQKWAKHMTDIIADKVRPSITGEKKGSQDVAEKVNKVLGTNYTPDEIADMRKGLINDGLNKSQS